MGGGSWILSYIWCHFKRASPEIGKTCNDPPPYPPTNFCNIDPISFSFQICRKNGWRHMGKPFFCRFFNFWPLKNHFFGRRCPCAISKIHQKWVKNHQKSDSSSCKNQFFFLDKNLKTTRNAPYPVRIVYLGQFRYFPGGMTSKLSKSTEISWFQSRENSQNTPPNAAKRRQTPSNPSCLI